MSGIIERDVHRLATAARRNQIKNIKTMLHIHKYLFHVKGTWNQQEILMTFDPSQRLGGGSTTRKNTGFAKKKAWALKKGFLFYVAKRDEPTLSMEIHLRGWLMQLTQYLTKEPTNEDVGGFY